VLATDGSFRLASDPVEPEIKDGIVPGTDLLGQSAADWWQDCVYALNDMMHTKWHMVDKTLNFPVALNANWHRSYCEFQPSFKNGTYSQDMEARALSRTIADDIDAFLLNRAGISVSDCYVFETWPFDDETTENIADGAVGGSGITVYKGFVYDFTSAQQKMRRYYCYRSVNWRLPVWGWDSNSSVVSDYPLVRRPPGSTIAADGNDNVKLGRTTGGTSCKLSLFVRMLKTEDMTDIVGPTVDVVISSQTSADLLTGLKNIDALSPDQGLLPLDAGVPWICLEGGAGGGSFDVRIGEWSVDSGWHAHIQLYGDRTQYASLPGYLPATNTMAYPWSATPTGTDQVMYHFLTSMYLGVVWSRHISELKMYPTLVQCGTSGSDVIVEVAADILYMRMPMLYLKDYALQLKALDPSLTESVDKTINDMAGYEDAVVTATLLSEAMIAPFEVLKSTQLYHLAISAGEDLYIQPFGENQTFKTAQNRINALPPQKWWLKIWDDALTTLEIIPPSLAAYVDDPYTYFVAQKIIDDSFLIVNYLGASTIAISTLDAAALLVNGMQCYNGDGIEYYVAQITLDAINTLLGDNLNLDGLQIHGSQNGGDWTSFQPEVFTDADGFPSPDAFSGDAMARMWMVYKGIDMSPLEKILDSLHDLNPFVVSTHD
jgi:hypothetical protein